VSPTPQTEQKRAFALCSASHDQHLEELTTVTLRLAGCLELKNLPDYRRA
jgi:hypothetical protein